MDVGFTGDRGGEGGGGAFDTLIDQSFFILNDLVLQIMWPKRKSFHVIMCKTIQTCFSRKTNLEQSTWVHVIISNHLSAILFQIMCKAFVLQHIEHTQTFHFFLTYLYTFFKCPSTGMVKAVFIFAISWISIACLVSYKNIHLRCHFILPNILYAQILLLTIIVIINLRSATL